MIKANCNHYSSVTAILSEVAVALTFEEVGPFYSPIDSANIYEAITVLWQGCRDKTEPLQNAPQGSYRKGRGSYGTCWEEKGDHRAVLKRGSHPKESLPSWF